jgi:hypothetical protein
MHSLPPPTLPSVLRIYRRYRRVFGRYPALMRPRLFSEKMQWRKLFDLNPQYAVFCDKIATRDYVAARGGRELVVPLLWTGESVDDIPFDRLEPSYVLKCNNSSGANAFVLSREALDVPAVKTFLRSHLERRHGHVMLEPGYVPVRPRLLAEPLLRQSDGSYPLEHKIFVFGGRAHAMITVVVDRARVRRNIYHDRDWNLLRWKQANPRYDGELPRPDRLNDIISAAERLGAGFDHVRVDMYDWDVMPKVGEITVYHWSGMVPFEPPDVDRILGDCWVLERPVRRAVAALLTRRRSRHA